MPSARVARSIRVLAVALYGLALLVSHHARTNPPRSSSGASKSVALIHQQSGEQHRERQVRIAYRDVPAQHPRTSLPVLMIHGSPGRKEDFDALASVVSADARVIVPDLPGFGASTRQLPDYSIRAGAEYLVELLDALGLTRVHVLGYSMGGGVALNLVDIAPERVTSLTMLSAIGVQELELTGEYHANHVVHGAQLAGIWLLQEGTPHFGLLDRSPLDVAYARNFFDSDQRPLRGVLQRVEVPALVIHGLDDPLVPLDAAMEHARLLPQSELVTLPGGHMLVHWNAELVGAAVASFVRRVETGVAPKRGDAEPSRALAAVRPLDVGRLPKVRGIAAVVFGGLLAFGTALLGGFGAVVAGVFVARGRIALVTATAACIVGALVRTGFASPEPAENSVTRRLGTAILVTGLRVLAAAGVMWVLLRTPLSLWQQPYRGFAVGLGLTAGVIYVAERSATHKARRLWVSRWRRATRWEFWPAWVFYPPVVAYIAYLMLKHRSMTLFTAANPSILAGGVVGESKADILRGLADSGDAVARFVLVPGAATAADKQDLAKQFMDSRELRFPVVLKPNHGQRGSGVVIVRSAEMLHAALELSGVDTILQEYVTGEEFGVFYYRRPSEAHGRIFSITQKMFPAVVGDGRRTLERLILDDERAVCSARLYCERHREQLSTVLAAGLEFPLAELGSHCRGAVFLDGASLRTDALERRIDAIARSFDGFYFGRFDVRVPGGAESLCRGEGIKVLELNGVTSEATHIYHPGTPLLAAYRVLAEQWRIAFEIGAENRARGVRPTPLHDVVRLARAYRDESHGHLAERPTVAVD